jgi:hypothetical protein
MTLPYVNNLPAGDPRRSMWLLMGLRTIGPSVDWVTLDNGTEWWVYRNGTYTPKTPAIDHIEYVEI